jgi:hypothetical protein
MPSVPAELRSQPLCAAVGPIFDAFGSDQRIWRHVNLQQSDDEGPSTIDFFGMLSEGTLSEEEAVLIATAATLWSDRLFADSLTMASDSVEDPTLRTVLRTVAAHCWPHPTALAHRKSP